MPESYYFEELQTDVEPYMRKVVTTWMLEVSGSMVLPVSWGTRAFLRSKVRLWWSGAGGKKRRQLLFSARIPVPVEGILLFLTFDFRSARKLQ